MSDSTNTASRVCDFDCGKIAGQIRGASVSVLQAFVDLTNYCSEHGCSGGARHHNTAVLTHPSTLRHGFLHQLQRRGATSRIAPTFSPIARAPAAAASRLRAAVAAATRLTCSAGVAPNRRLAKLCSDVNKPNGQFELPPDRERILAFLAPLPARDIKGIGRVTVRW